MFVGHCKAVNSDGKLGQRIVQVVMAALLITPVIGQIIALFELAVVKALGLAKDNPPSKLLKSKLQENNDEPANRENFVNQNPSAANTTSSTPSKIWPGNWTTNQCILGLGVAAITALGVVLTYNHFNFIPAVDVVPPKKAIYPLVSDKIKACLDYGLFKVKYPKVNININDGCGEFLKNQLCGAYDNRFKQYCPSAKFNFLNQCVKYIDENKHLIFGHNKFELGTNCIALVENTCKN